MKKILLSIAVVATLFSCEKDENKKVENGIEAPSTYKFERNNQSSISFSGQTARLEMAEEIGSALNNNTLSEESIKEMLNEGKGFSDDNLNNSGKKIGNKIAASNDTNIISSVDALEVQGQFNNLIKNQVDEVFPKWESNASKGVAGKITESDNTIRRVNAKGLEYDQAIIKGLIGAFTFDQIANYYTSELKLNSGNNDSVAEGKNYTEMEHYWDEGFGYLYGLETNIETPEYGVDNLLNKYAGKLNGKDVDMNIVYNAFVRGRKAIVSKDYDARDNQAEIIREELSKIITNKAIDYLEEGASIIDNELKPREDAFHDLSEGYGFIISLQFTEYFSHSDVEGYLKKLEKNDGFWDITSDELNNIAEDIKTKAKL